MKVRLCDIVWRGFVLFFLFALPRTVLSQDISPIVTAQWLAANLNNPRLVMIDIRKVEDYREGHIPGAISAYYGMWAFSESAQHTEYPPEDELFDAIGDLGIGKDSLVVIICKTYICFYQVMAPRVLTTLQYVGLKNISILDGGHEAWVRERRPVSTETTTPKKTIYEGTPNKTLHVGKDYVASRLGKARFVDVREPEWYRGERRQEFVKKPGHIPGAVNLPASEAYTALGTFKRKEELASLVAQTVGTDRSEEIITYCDAGRCCPTWAFIMSRILGYEQVKLYDGSFEEWTQDASMPISR